MKTNNCNLIISFKTRDFRQIAFFAGKLLILTLLAKAVLLGALFLFSPASSVQAVSADINAQELIKLTNLARKQNNIPELIINQKLETAALEKARDLLAKNYFAHTSPNGRPFYRWIQEADYQYQSAGENLAIDFITNKAVVKAWMESPGHRDNILNQEFKEIGMATVAGQLDQKNTIMIVQLFGQPLTELTAARGTVASANNNITQLPNKRNILANMNYLLNLISLTLSLVLIILFAKNYKRTIHELRRFAKI